MITSVKIDLITAALVNAQKVMEGAKKTSTNPFYHSQYADLAEVWDTCRKPLTDNGLCFVQSIGSEKVTSIGKAPIKNREGNTTGERDIIYIWLSVTSRLLHISEQWFEDTISIPVEADPQSIGKATTYIRRYMQMALCGIAPEDDDAEGAMGRKEAKQKKAETEAKSSPPSETQSKVTAGAVSGSPPSDPSNWCLLHETYWFMRGKMASFAHPIGETGKWCHKPKQGAEAGDTPKQANPEKSIGDLETAYAQFFKAVEQINPKYKNPSAVCAELTMPDGKVPKALKPYLDIGHTLDEIIGFLAEKNVVTVPGKIAD